MTTTRTVTDMLLDAFAAAWQMLDNSEERVDVGEIVAQASDVERFTVCVDELDALPDDMPGCVMSAPAKARWALREHTFVLHDGEDDDETEKLHAFLGDTEWEGDESGVTLYLRASPGDEIVRTSEGAWLVRKKTSSSSSTASNDDGVDPATTDLLKPRGNGGVVSADICRDAMLLVGDTDVTDIPTWSQSQMDEAYDWAMRVHLNASDNDDVLVPSRPSHCRRRT